MKMAQGFIVPLTWKEWLFVIDFGADLFTVVREAIIFISPVTTGGIGHLFKRGNPGTRAKR